MLLLLILAFAFYYQLLHPFDDDNYVDDDHVNVDNDDKSSNGNMPLTPLDRNVNNDNDATPNENNDGKQPKNNNNK